MAEPLRVCVTGAAGQIAYSLLYSIGKGDVFGSNQPITLLLLDIPPMMTALGGVIMELQDCSLPLLHEIVGTADVAEAFKNIDVAILVGAMPRKEGMERKDLLKANAKIFEVQGKALDEHAKKTVKVVVIGNPANTNCLITSKCAPSIPKENFSCLTKLDQNRAISQISLRLGVKTTAVKNIIVWGNHSATQYPDVQHGTVELNGQTVSVKDAVKDDEWLQGEFMKVVQTRGGAIIKARKLSSAMSAAKAICDHMRLWWFGTPEDDVTSMGVVSDGSYGIPDGIVYSFPVKIDASHNYKIVQGLDINQFSREKMDISAKELCEERDVAFSFLQQ
ncbi:malate dehydrogenase, cytoplasmic-like [Hydractinia symbiolongicarpus]|uniref:malate dehydrogenase, cytoplasmic-like n=1 Tax=Hydractinia symbiolongicarpus TaxID=13093 RepID=UPI00254DB9E5|nr:malate dehydrogenase, cytoplasmic-like [Hydractinia symbiolongicarpus]